MRYLGGRPPEILDRRFKTRPTTDHRAKFHAGRPTHLGDLALTKKTPGLKHKFSRKLSFPGGLTKNLGQSKRESARRPKSDWGEI